jgi:hypothetical protein
LKVRRMTDHPNRTAQKSRILQLPNRSPVGHLLGEDQSASHFVF